MDLCIVKSNKKVTEVTLINYPNIKHIAAIVKHTGATIANVINKFENTNRTFSFVILSHSFLTFIIFFFSILENQKNYKSC